MKAYVKRERAHRLSLSAKESLAALAASRQHVVEIVTYCVRMHAYRMRYFIILNNLVHKVRPSAPHAPHRMPDVYPIRSSGFLSSFPFLPGRAPDRRPSKVPTPGRDPLPASHRQHQG
jgi:hypothetical protein